MADDLLIRATVALHDLDCHPDCGDSLTTMSRYARQAQAVLAALDLEARGREHYRAGRTAASRALAGDLAEAMNHTADPVARAAYQHAAALADRLAEAGREELDRLLTRARRDAAEAVAALAELVALKDGPRGEGYELRKPAAWDAARDIARRYAAGHDERPDPVQAERDRIARALQALTTDRLYGTLIPRDEALAIVTGEAGANLAGRYFDEHHAPGLASDGLPDDAIASLRKGYVRDALRSPEALRQINAHYDTRPVGHDEEDRP